jgi:urease accessory protein UreH
MHARFGLAGHTVLGTMFVYPGDDALLSLARTVLLSPGAKDSSASGSPSEECAPHPVIAGAASTAGRPVRASRLSAARSSRSAHIACTKVDGVLVCRAIGSQADAVRQALASIWSLIRPGLIGRAATPPRIWST